MGYVVFGIRCALALVFAAAVLGKLRNPQSFKDFRRSVVDMFPPARGHATTFAVVVTGAESAVIALLAVPVTGTVGLGASLALLTGFTAAMVIALRGGSRASCGCFGRSVRPLGASHLIRNGFLLLIAAVGLVTDVTAGPADLWTDLWEAPVGLAVAGGSAGVTAMLVLNADAIVDLFVGPPLGPARTPKDLKEVGR